MEPWSGGLRGTRVVVALVLAGCAAAAWAAHGAPAPPVDTRGGIEGRIAAGCGRDVAALERASSGRVRRLQALDTAQTELAGRMDAQSADIDALRTARIAAEDAADAGRARSVRRREREAVARYQAM